MADQKCMPLLIINMGGEMMYILQQRLQAQNIGDDKSRKVLSDVISTMFGEKFVQELFKPQACYSGTSTRQIFDRLAHSSIMRLNESSMSKLYDLMTMGVKYQIMFCATPNEMCQVTLNHLYALQELTRDSAETHKLVKRATDLTLDMFQDMTMSDFFVLRQSLLRFFQDRKIKVSLFLQDGFQSQDGSITISHRGALPPGTERCGTVRYFKGGSVSREEVVEMDNAKGVTSSPSPFSLRDPKTSIYSKLGGNLYARNRTKPKPAKKVEVNRHAPPLEKTSDYKPDDTATKAASSELNSLASMIGGGSGASKVSLNLFPDTSLGGGSGSSREKTADVIVFDAEDASAYAKLSAEFDGGDDEKEEEDDLLALMDDAI